MQYAEESRQEKFHVFMELFSQTTISHFLSFFSHFTEQHPESDFPGISEPSQRTEKSFA